MKKLITILLFISILSDAQEYEYKSKLKDGIAVSGMFISSIVLNSIGDAWLADNHNQILAHSFRATSIACLLAVPFVTDIRKDKWYLYFLSYTTLRIGLFDPIYNYSRGFPINETHEVSLWDKGVKGVTGNNNMGLFVRSIPFMVGFSIPIKYRL